METIIVIGLCETWKDCVKLMNTIASQLDELGWRAQVPKTGILNVRIEKKDYQFRFHPITSFEQTPHALSNVNFYLVRGSMYNDTVKQKFGNQIKGSVGLKPIFQIREDMDLILYGNV